MKTGLLIQRVAAIMMILTVGTILNPSLANATDIQLFPPTNTDQCNSNTALMFDGTHSVYCNSPIPSSAVMMFNLPTCPTGWTALPGMAGRVVIGTGSYSETSPGSNPAAFSNTYSVGDVGGAAFRSLTMAQMPKHSHNARFTGGADDHDFSSLWAVDINQQGYIEWDWLGLAAGAGSAPAETPATDRYGHSLLAADGDGLGPFVSNSWAGGTSDLNEGQSQPVDTRMPYVALTFCQKN